MDLLLGLLSNVTSQPWYVILVEVIGLFAVVARFTPNEVDNKIGQFLLKLVNQIGMNGGPNANNE